MIKSKIESYVGFALRARKIRLGSGAISTLRGGVELLIMDGGAAKNSQRLALKFKNRFSCPLVVCETGFADLVGKPDCKIAAICDKSLAGAILDNLDGNFRLYVLGGDDNEV